MKVATLVVFKNEADILPYWLNYMDKYVDYFLFRDNESTDGSGEIVKNHPKTVYYDVVKGKYTTSMRDLLFEKAQDFLDDSDWICGGAPDLLPYFDVRREIKKADKEGFTCVKAHFPTFFFTREMYEKYKDNEKYKQQIDNFDAKNYKYYLNVSNYFENIVKNTKDSKGKRIGYVRDKQEPPYIPNKKSKKSSLCWGHFRFRSPAQMKERMSIRSKVNPKGERKKSFSHYPTWNWKKYLIPQNKLLCYDGEFNNKRYKLDKIINRENNG